MTINGKRDNFTADDLRAVARLAGLKRGRGDTILREVTDVVGQWPQIADDVGVDERLRDEARETHRLGLPQR
jgi:serine/threonine-protein kinase HipA